MFVLNTVKRIGLPEIQTLNLDSMTLPLCYLECPVISSTVFHLYKPRSYPDKRIQLANIFLKVINSAPDPINRGQYKPETQLS